MTTEIAKTEGKDVLKNLIEKNRDFIAKAAPKHVSPERLMQMALTAYTSVNGLRECWTPSVIGGIVQASIVGLELNTPLGQAYLIPFNDKKLGKKIAQFIIGYKGLIKLMQNSGALKSIHADKVCANDLFEYEYGSDQKLRHVPATGNRGAVTHFYCYVIMKDGGFQMEVMPKSQVDSIMARSPTRGEFGPWKDHYDEMGIKTSVRRIAKYVPLSAEVADAIQSDAMGDVGLQDLSPLAQGATIDGEVIPERTKVAHDPAPAAEAPKPRRGRPPAAKPAPAPEPEPSDDDSGDGDGLPFDEPDGAGTGSGPTESAPAAGNAPAPAVGFDGWLTRVEAATLADDLDVLEDEIRDMSKAVQGLAKREIERRRAALQEGLD